MRIAIVGPGAIGGTIAAWLGEVRGVAVTLCARHAFSELQVVTPERTLVSHPPVLVDAAAVTETFDWVIAVTKTYDTAGAATWLRALVGPSTCVAVMQNGVEHLTRFADVVPAARTLPVIVDIPAERSAPGRIVQRRQGDITVPEGELGARFARLFSGTPLAPQLTSDFTSAAWRKLALNAAGAVNALTLRPAEVAKDAAAAELMRALAREAVAVGRAEGALLDDGLPDHVVARYESSAPNSVNSLLADRLAGRPMELDARNGVIVRLGAKHGILTPSNAMAVTLLETSACLCPACLAERRGDAPACTRHRSRPLLP